MLAESSSISGAEPGFTGPACPNTLCAMTAAPPTVPVQLLADRLRRARAAAAVPDVDLLLVPPGTDLRYLLGLGGESHERLTCLVLPATGPRAPPGLGAPPLGGPG